MFVGVIDFGPGALSDISVHIDHKDRLRYIDFVKMQLFQHTLLRFCDLNPVALLKETNTEYDMSCSVNAASASRNWGLNLVEPHSVITAIMYISFSKLFCYGGQQPSIDLLSLRLQLNSTLGARGFVCCESNAG